ncbi:LbetaH domain-containing protein [Candidatus Nucleicultrix amoebiphila]|uniref:hypothetical protein n=1 Tax=Candidatus Nucleicultrix amoebiphila TaxID=1509244 RepID=UPI0018DE036A|nr:hypothetical protein [Candidatus Nucleicultrix amoebiphila]
MRVFDPNISTFLIGVGGHAKSLYESLESVDSKLIRYLDPLKADWLESLGIAKISQEDLEKELSKNPQVIISFLGGTSEALKKRLELMKLYNNMGGTLPIITHSRSSISARSKIDDGCQVFAGAMVNAFSHIGFGAVVNTNAVIEHDVVIEEGVHVAPSAVILGGAHIGSNAYIGSNAVIIQNTRVPEGVFVKAGSIWNKE